MSEASYLIPVILHFQFWVKKSTLKLCAPNLLHFPEVKYGFIKKLKLV